jgi:DNA-binding NarL/FixJ family response regulator
VLLVDDFALMLDRAAEVLTPTCEIVGAVQDGSAALHAAATLQPDVIVLDISLNGLSGLDVAARLRAAGSTAAVVFLTLHEEQALVQAARAAGGLGYVVKRRLVSDLATAVLEARAGRPFVSVT